MKTIKITIRDLKSIIENAEMLIKYDSSLSDTIELKQLSECDTHNGSDAITAHLKSSYRECVGSAIYFKRNRP